MSLRTCAAVGWALTGAACATAPAIASALSKLVILQFIVRHLSAESRSAIDPLASELGDPGPHRCLDLWRPSHQHQLANAVRSVALQVLRRDRLRERRDDNLKRGHIAAALGEQLAELRDLARRFVR